VGAEADARATYSVHGNHEIGVRRVDVEAKFGGGCIEWSAVGVAKDECTGIKFPAVGFEGIFRGFHGNGSEAETQSRERVVGIVADEEGFALAVDAAGSIDFADFAHGRVEDRN